MKQIHRKRPAILSQTLSELFNASFKYGYIHQHWKTTFAVFIPKHNKNAVIFDIYSPIALTYTTDELCETLLVESVRVLKQIL